MLVSSISVSATSSNAKVTGLFSGVPAGLESWRSVTVARVRGL